MNKFLMKWSAIAGLYIGAALAIFAFGIATGRI